MQTSAYRVIQRAAYIYASYHYESRCLIAKIIGFILEDASNLSQLVTWGTLKMRDMKLRDMKMRHHVAGVENARHENARNAIVWNTACCICLSIAEQECT